MPDEAVVSKEAVDLVAMEADLSLLPFSSLSECALWVLVEWGRKLSARTD